jgi:hypothetical protein
MTDLPVNISSYYTCVSLTNGQCHTMLQTPGTIFDTPLSAPVSRADRSGHGANESLEANIAIMCLSVMYWSFQISKRKIQTCLLPAEQS